MENRPGSLHACLGVLKAHGLNMDKLESRPSRQRAWEYVFWIDTDADLRDPDVQAAFRELAAASSTLRILGSYPSCNPVAVHMSAPPSVENTA